MNMKSMRLAPRTLIVPFALAVAALAGRASIAQTPAPTPVRGAQELASGWTALAGGRTAEAAKIADGLLRTVPRSHEALALAIRARTAGRNATGALDVYEAWLQRPGQREDAYLLESVAIGVLETHAASSDPMVRSRALELLAAVGDATASAQLNAAAAGTGSVTTDLALARSGDAKAVQRLTQQIKEGGRDVSHIIDALRDGNVKNAAGVIATALDPSRPLPTRVAAARALGDLGSTESIPRLKEALKDPNPPVRVMAAVALSRLGDDSGAELVRTLESSPVGDLRLLVAEGNAAGNPTGAWVAVATGVLQDPDPLVRLRAAELLANHAADPGPGLQVLQESMADSNPAMRAAAARSLSRLSAAALERDLPALRKLLRDPSPILQVEGAAGILRVSGAV